MLDDAEWEWMPGGRCKTEGVGTKMFFPPFGEPHLVKLAKAFCSTCPVVEECLDYAIDNSIEHGVWGGQSEHERRLTSNARLRRRR